MTGFSAGALKQRGEAATRIAKLLAEFDGYVWQAHPNAAQERKQFDYEMRAYKVIQIVETRMWNWRWHEDDRD